MVEEAHSEMVGCRDIFCLRWYALILLVICLWYIFWHKERKIEIGLCTEGIEATSRIVLRECNNGENTVTAIGEFTFPEGFVPNRNLSSEILQRLNEVRKGGWGGVKEC